MVLAEHFNKYDKESLKHYAQELLISKTSSLRKADLINKIVENLLDPYVMYYRMSLLDDNKIRVFEKAIEKGGYKPTETEFDHACTLNELDYASFDDNNVLLVADDVAEAWKKLNDDHFKVYRKKASWIHKCMYWCTNMYVIAPMDVMLEVCNAKKGIKLDEDELRAIVQNMPMDLMYCDLFSDTFIDSFYLTNLEALDSIKMAQGDKPYYIPSSREVEELFDTCALISDKPYQDMLKFMTGKLKMEKEEAEDILLELWGKISWDNDPHETMQWFWNQFEFENEKLVNEIVGLYMPLCNNTRMMPNRGHRPTEIRTPLKPGQRMTVVPGSTKAANMLAEAMPEIQGMGIDVDLDSNADRIPVFGFPNGINGQPVMAEKKIYPNDPCPCGSGKKYKKCCGKK